MMLASRVWGEAILIEFEFAAMAAITGVSGYQPGQTFLFFMEHLFMSESIVIAVSGMKCGGCENTINTTLQALDGVVAVKASHVDKRVAVDFDPELIDVEDIEDAIEDAGFQVE
jgi:copper chaperone CopZ